MVSRWFQQSILIREIKLFYSLYVERLVYQINRIQTFIIVTFIFLWISTPNSPREYKSVISLGTLFLPSSIVYILLTFFRCSLSFPLCYRFTFSVPFLSSLKGEFMFSHVSPWIQTTFCTRSSCRYLSFFFSTRTVIFQCYEPQLL